MCRALVCWTDGHGAATPLGNQLDDVEAGRRTQQLADFARLQAPGHLGVQRRQAVERAEAEIATLQGIRRIGEGGRQFGEVLAGRAPASAPARHAGAASAVARDWPIRARATGCAPTGIPRRRRPPAWLAR